MATLNEMMMSMPKYAIPEKLEGTNATIQFNFSGEEPGDYVLRVREGTPTVETGTVEDADATILAPSEVWKAISLGEMNPMTAFMSGQFKAQGNIALLMQMQGWFNPPA